MSFSAVFLGTGSASSALGNSSCLIEKDRHPWLLIDCGHDTLSRYAEYCQGSLPSHIFITHLHFDHIGGLEQLFFKSTLGDHQANLYVPAPLVPTLCTILSNTGMAEGKTNVWDSLRLIPVLNQFWHQEYSFCTYPARHHAPNSAFSLHLPGVFFYSGDTRPTPEVLHHNVQQGEVIFHDCCVNSNPSHCGVEDILREYDANTLERLMAYHYFSPREAALLNQKGIATITEKQRISLPYQHTVSPVFAKLG